MKPRLVAVPLIVVACLGGFYSGVQMALAFAYGFSGAALWYGLALLVCATLGIVALRLLVRR